MFFQLIYILINIIKIYICLLFIYFFFFYKNKYVHSKKKKIIIINYIGNALLINISYLDKINVGKNYKKIKILYFELMTNIIKLLYRKFNVNHKNSDC